MAQHTITITGSDPGDNQPTRSRLTLSDGDKTVVEKGDVVTWIIDKDCPQITSILIKDDNLHFDLFDPGPAPTTGTHWMGIVNSNHGRKGDEHYTISWSEGEKTYSFDPIIQVNPKP